MPKLLSQKYRQKDNDKNWLKDIENIFTEEELNKFVKSKHLEIVHKNNVKHYIKYGTKRWFKEAK